MADINMEFNSVFQVANSLHVEKYSDYRAVMTWDKRLKDAFKETGWSKAELARRASESYDSVTKYLAGKVKQPRGDTLERLAHALNMDPLFLEKGIDSAAGETSIPLVGYVGAGAEVVPDFEQIPPEGLEQITIPFAIPDELIAFQVRGDSMLPQFRGGTTIIVYREQRRATETFYGEEAAVRTTDGRRFIKTIMRGQDGINLISWNAEPIEGISLDWIGEIFAVLPAAAMRRAQRVGGIQGQLPLQDKRKAQR